MMDTLASPQQTRHRPWLALSLVDRLAQALHVGGAFPGVLGALRCELVARTAPVQQAYAPPRALTTFVNRSGYLMLDGTYADPREPGRCWPLGAGSYRVRLRADVYRDAEFQLDWPPTPGQRRIPVPTPGNDGSVELLPSASYPLPDVTLARLQLGPTILRGAAFGADGTPLAGVAVAALNLPLLQPSNLPPLTDWPFLRSASGANGDWALLLPGRRYIDTAPEIAPANTLPLTRQIAIQVDYPDGSVTTVQEVVLGSEHAVRNTALRGQVLGPGSRPLAGVAITTSAGPRSTRTRADGQWSLYFRLDQAAVGQLAVTATPAGQPAQTDTSATLQPGATVFVPTFHFP